jgi:hypothetical protein
MGKFNVGSECFQGAAVIEVKIKAIATKSCQDAVRLFCCNSTQMCLRSDMTGPRSFRVVVQFQDLSTSNEMLGSTPSVDRIGL